MADLNQVLTQVATNQNTNQSGSQNTTQSSNQFGSQSMSGNASQQQTPYYTQGQLDMQGQAGNLMQQILQGNIQNLGPTQAQLDAGNALFNQRILPKLSAVHGSGSPALNAANQDFNLQLLAQTFPQQQQFAQNAYNSLAQFAFNPTGWQQQSNQNSTQNNSATSNSLSNTIQNMLTQSNGTQTNTDVGGMLGSILSSLSGILGGM